SELIRVEKDNLGNWVVGNARPAEGTTKATPGSGTEGASLDQNSFTGPSTASLKKGLFSLENADLFNLLCIPPYKDDGNVDQGLVEEAAAYCEQKRAMLLVDPPASWNSATKAIGDPSASPPSGISSITISKNAAIFFPRLRQPNPLRDNKFDDF